MRGCMAWGRIGHWRGLREFEFFVRGWIVAGEMFAACTRASRTPMLG